MDLLKAIELAKRKNNAGLAAVFTGKNNEYYIATIYSNNYVLSIEVYDKNLERAGYILIDSNHGNKLFLSAIYTYDKFRGNGIASKLSSLTDYVLRDYEETLLRGVYTPTQLSTDRENNIERPKHELEARASAFYTSNGYTILNHDEYSLNPDKYPEISEDDFWLGEEPSDTIVYKTISKLPKSNYRQINDLIIHKAIFEEFLEKYPQDQL